MSGAGEKRHGPLVWSLVRSRGHILGFARSCKSAFKRIESVSYKLELTPQEGERVDGALHLNNAVGEAMAVLRFVVHFNADPNKQVKYHRFVQVDQTNVYRHIAPTAEWSVVVINVEDGA